MRVRQNEENPTQYRPLRRGWFFGDNAFRKELLGQMIDKVSQNHYAAERQETSQEKAERIVAKELKRRRWTSDSLADRPKGDFEKVLIAQRLRSETVMTLKWIAHRLQMGSWTHLSNCLARNRKCH
jgi:hypothetical protein